MFRHLRKRLPSHNLNLPEQPLSAFARQANNGRQVTYDLAHSRPRQGPVNSLYFDEAGNASQPCGYYRHRNGAEARGNIDSSHCGNVRGLVCSAT